MSLHPALTPSTATASPPVWRSLRTRLGALLLAVGSVQFFVAMAVEQALRPGYVDVGPDSNTISDLGVNINGWSYDWIFNSSIILLGVVSFLGILALYPVFPRRRLAYVAEGLLVLGIVGAVGVGLFPETSTALGGHAHDFWSVWTFLFANTGLLVMGLAMFGHEKWGRHAWLTTLLGLLATVSLGFYVENWLVKGAYLGLGEGGLERIVAFPVLLWAIYISAVILTHRGTGSGSPAAAASATPSPSTM